MGLTLTLISRFYISNSQIHLLPEILKGLSNSKCHQVYAIFLFLSVQKLYLINFFRSHPRKVRTTTYRHKKQRHVEHLIWEQWFSS